MTIKLRHLALANCLLLLLLVAMDAYAGKPPPNINQCKGKWVFTNVTTALAYGAFSIDSGTGTIRLSSGGGLSAIGDIGLSASQPVSPYTVTLDNSRGSTCANYGFDLNWSTAPQPLVNGAASMNLSAYVYEPTLAPAFGATFPITVAPGSGLTLPLTFTIYGDIAVAFPQTAGAYASPIFDISITQSGTTVLSTAVTATATSLAPISLLEAVPMYFGTVAGSSIAGTVILDTASARTITGGGQILSADPGTAATFQITGSASQTYILTISASATLESGSGDQITATTFTNNSLGTIPVGGTESFQVGATLNLNSLQPAGTYSTLTGGGSPYTITVNYN